MRFLPLLLLLPLPALASETPWQEVAPGVRLRMIASDVLRPDGTTLAGLEIDMPSGTRTYWRVPGESGIPTMIDFEGSSGIHSKTILWPYPEIERGAGPVDFVYSGPTVLPLSLGVDPSGGLLKAAVTLGICSDICIPATATFTLPLGFDTPDSAEALRIAQAIAEVPIAWDGNDAAIGDVRFDAAADALTVEVADPAIDKMSFIVDAKFDAQLVATPQNGPERTVVLLPLLGRSEHGDLGGREITLTFMTDEGPYVVTRQIEGSTSGRQ